MGVDRLTFLTIVQVILLVTNPELVGLIDPQIIERGANRVRTRRYVTSIMDELGPYYTRRAYRMPADHFWRLHRLIHPYLKCGKAKVRDDSTKRNENNGAPNGIIPSTSRLSAAIRYFSGGDPCDIAVVHGISHTEVFNSAWAVVDAVNHCPELEIKYPKDHNEQRKIARGFQKRSKPGFNCCAGAIDGMLVWIQKPTEEQCQIATCGRKKFFCGRKHKFGLNLQAVCDAECRFLDIDMSHPAATSDYLAHTTSTMHDLLEDNILAPGLCLFGDNAYVNRSFMATPFKAVSGGVKDDYNFYHSQLRIKIECSFGMLVNRWGILRSALSSQLTLQKVGCLVMCLCRLHNFCINERLRDAGSDEEDILPATEVDEFQIASSGGVPLEQSSRDPFE